MGATLGNLLKSSGGAEWYFIGATFVFAGTGIFFADSHWVVRVLLLVVGLLLVVVGIVVWSRAAQRAGDEQPGSGGDAGSVPPPRI